MKSNTDGEEDNVVDQLEVTFVDDSNYRRKSSMSTSKQKRPAAPRKTTSCFVHGLLQDHRLNGAHPFHDGTPSNEESATDKDPYDHKGSRTDSRLLSKKELSDMAFSIRELSKRLSRFKLKLNVKNVFLLTKAHDEELVGLTREVADWLLSRDDAEAHTV